MSTWDDKPNDYEHAIAEIERLRAALEKIADPDIAWGHMKLIARNALDHGLPTADDVRGILALEQSASEAKK